MFLKGIQMVKVFNLIFCFVMLFSASLKADYKLVWSEEFDQIKIDADIWNAETNPGVVYGAHQQQFFTDRKNNSFIKDGKLTIRAQKEHYVINDYTSARLNTYGTFGVVLRKDRGSDQNSKRRRASM